MFLFTVFVFVYRGGASSVSIVSDYDWTTGRSRFDPGRRQRGFFSSLCVQNRYGPTQPPVQCVPGILSPRIKRGRGVKLTTLPHLVPRL
jgi:hypothetical protein